MLDFETFQIHFTRLMKWFNKKETSVNVDMWYSRLRDRVPNESFEPVINALIDSAKYFPTPQDILNLAQDWLLSHPEKQAYHHETHCPECRSTGVIKVRAPERRASQLFHRNTFYRCKHCKNWEGRLGTWIPAKFRWELEKMRGLEILTERQEQKEIETVAGDPKDLLPEF